ncbi:MAG: DegV family protein [candidate division WOR-3 bacterium]
MRKIIVDSGVGLPGDFVKKYNIEIVPVNLFSENGEDFSEKSYEEILYFMKKGKILRPSGISTERLIKTYRKYKDREIISIHIGSTISGITQTANLVAKKLKEENINVHVIDTLNAGPAAGIPIFKNIEKILDESISPLQIEKEIQDVSYKVEMFFTIRETKRLLRVRPVEGLKKIIKNPGMIIKYITMRGGKPLISLKLGKFKTVGFVKEEVEGLIDFLMKNYLKRKDKVIAFTFGCEREKDEEKIIEFFKENFEGEFHKTPPLPLWAACAGIGFLGVAFYKEHES